MRKHVRLGSRRLHLPHSPSLRVGLGIALVLGGFLGFLPILGFWMIPLGLLVLSVDLPAVRRWRRRMEVFLFRTWQDTVGPRLRRWWYRLKGAVGR